MTTFVVDVIVAWKLVLFTLGVVPHTADSSGLTATPVGPASKYAECSPALDEYNLMRLTHVHEYSPQRTYVSASTKLDRFS
jgi:hypothetical protein